MQNEFEKQVQQKMEELNLTPSAPVWKNVEEQIRKKKDSQRFFLWVPLLMVLLAGGFYLIQNKKSATQNAFHPSKNKAPKKQTVKIQLNRQHTIQSMPERKILTATKEKSFHNISSVAVPKTNKTLKAVATSQRNFFLFKDEVKPPVASFEKSFVEKINEQSSNTNQTKKLRATNTQQEIISKESKTVSTNSINKTDTANKKEDAVVPKFLKPKPTKSKWKYAIAFNAGTSGLSNRSLAGNVSSSPVYNAGGGVTANNSSGLDRLVKPANGVFASFGLAVTKPLSKRIVFSTGLLYNYYSNSVQVGSGFDSSNNGMPTRYYSNDLNGSSPYHQHFHFISVPLAINLQLFRNLPLHFKAGISFQQLIYSNGLKFDFSLQRYYYDKTFFNRVEVFSQLGLLYSVLLKQRSFVIGPQFQYGLSRLENMNSGRHLYSIGLSAKISLKKNN